MENENDVILESSPEEEANEEANEESSNDSEVVENPAPAAPIKPAEKVVPYNRFKEVNEELKALRGQMAKAEGSLDVVDYIDISAALNGLDQREQEKLAYEHKLTGKPLTEIKKSEDFQLWQSAYRAKVEKEKLTMEPSSRQTDSDRPKTLSEKLAGAASIEEKEKLLSEMGLYKSPRSKSDRVNIGSFR